MAFLLLNGTSDISDETGAGILDETGNALLDETSTTGGYLQLATGGADTDLLLEDGTQLLLEDGVTTLTLDGGVGGYLVLAVADNNAVVTFPIIQVDSITVLEVFDESYFPLIRVDAFGTLGPIQPGNVTFPLLYVAAVDVVNQPGNVVFPTLAVNGYGFVNVQAGSGLYKMDAAHQHDTVYTAVHNGTTADNAIKNPFVQTYLAHDDEENLIHCASMKIRAIGNGILRSTLYTMDSIRSQNLQNITMSSTMNREPTVLANLISRRMAVRIYTNSIDEEFDVSRIIIYLKPVYTQIPDSLVGA